MIKTELMHVNCKVVTFAEAHAFCIGADLLGLGVDY
jgi:hypothetical protein